MTDVEERLRALEEDRASLMRQVGVLRGKEAERDRQKERDKAIGKVAIPIGIGMCIFWLAVIGALVISAPH